MVLKEVLKNIDCEIYGDCEIEVSELCHESGKAKEGSMFFCLKGTNIDGHDFALDAYKNGSNTIVTNKLLDLPKDVVQVLVKNTRETMSKSACNFYRNAGKDMIIVSITGTNGKTTSTFMLASILKSAGFKVGVIGTNGIIINGQKFESNMTTPDPILLQKTLKDMRDSGVQVVVMEMSAHALELQKNSGLMSDIAVFTNLTQDHLDYFKTMKNYGEAKKRLFSSSSSKFAVLNMDDPFSNEIIKTIDIPYVTVSINKNSDLIAREIKHNEIGQEYILSCDGEEISIAINLDGKFNVSNSIGAIAAAKAIGVSNEAIVSGLKNLKQVSGRFNTFFVGGKKFVVDYAHTPDGLENILNAAREILDPKGKLISVFGCGGNRDALKRPIMGEISTRLADVTIITSDNPRLENPIDIISQIEKGINGGIYLIEPDRAKAIKLAYNIATLNDLIVVSGKGAEDYMDVQGKKVHYNDGEVILGLGG